MKTLKGMKKNFSSLENKRLENMGVVRGGESTRSSPSQAVGENCSDTDYHTDAIEGNWDYKGRLIACGPYPDGIAP